MKKWQAQLKKSTSQINCQKSTFESQSIVKESQKFSNIKSRSKLVQEFRSYKKEDMLTQQVTYIIDILGTGLGLT